MKRFLISYLIVSCLAALSCLTLGAHYPDEKYSPNQMQQTDFFPQILSGGNPRELVGFLMELAQRNERVHKRNSEIINSLLGLPKVLNDAGR